MVISKSNIHDYWLAHCKYEDKNMIQLYNNTVIKKLGNVENKRGLQIQPVNAL